MWGYPTRRDRGATPRLLRICPRLCSANDSMWGYPTRRERGATPPSYTCKTLFRKSQYVGLPHTQKSWGYLKSHSMLQNGMGNCFPMAKLNGTQNSGSARPLKGVAICRAANGGCAQYVQLCDRPMKRPRA